MRTLDCLPACAPATMDHSCNGRQEWKARPALDFPPAAAPKEVVRAGQVKVVPWERSLSLSGFLGRSEPALLFLLALRQTLRQLSPMTLACAFRPSRLDSLNSLPSEHDVSFTSTGHLDAAFPILASDLLLRVLCFVDFCLFIFFFFFLTSTRNSLVPGVARRYQPRISVHVYTRTVWYESPRPPPEICSFFCPHATDPGALTVKRILGLDGCLIGEKVISPQPATGFQPRYRQLVPRPRLDHRPLAFDLSTLSGAQSGQLPACCSPLALSLGRLLPYPTDCDFEARAAQEADDRRLECLACTLLRQPLAFQCLVLFLQRSSTCNMRCRAPRGHLPNKA